MLLLLLRSYHTPTKSEQVSIPNNSTVVDSCNETRDLLISISASSAVVSARKDSEDAPKILSLEGHTLGEDVVQDDLVARFQNASLGTIHNPITID